MSRIRLSTLAAFAGILITTGGCAGSATAPEAATVRDAGASLDRSHRSERADSASTRPTQESGDGMTTLSSGYLGAGS